MEDILIVGTGAMACFFGARLASSGVKVAHLGTWEAGINALNQKGIQLISGSKEETFPVTASAVPEDFSGVKYALVLVKSWQTDRAASQVKVLLPPDGLAVTLQNGLGNFKILSDLLGRNRVAQGITTYGATLLGPGKVRLGGEGTITLGDHPRLIPLRAMLKDAGLKTNFVPRLEALVWEKLVINAAINPLTAVLRVTNGELLDNPSARALMVAIAEEVAGLASACGIPLQLPDPGRAVISVAARTASNRSSMLQDTLRGAQTEIDAICGAVVRRAAQINYPVPTIRVFYHLIQAQVGTKEITL